MKEDTQRLTTSAVEVRPEWLDSYGHMNMARYVAAFDELGYPLQDHIGVGAAYTAARRLGLFVVDARVTYRRELVRGQRFCIALRVLDADHIRLLTLQEMRLEPGGEVVATMEQLAVNASLESRRACPFEPELAASLQRLAARHRQYPLPTGFRPLLTCRPQGGGKTGAGGH